MYKNLTNQELIETYNAVMANAYPGDECELEAEMEIRNLEDIG
jgi:hypothetical protein|tara:strand:+ start:2528 stop:2656 length:129 start_codon:yes stop_codon:yes gene_type:complete